MENKFVVEVSWVSPLSGRLAPSERMLSLDVEVTDNANHSGFGQDGASELYLFEDKKSADTFKRAVDEFYQNDPQYFVIDDRGESALGEHGQPIVAWVPELSLRNFDNETDRFLFPGCV